MKILSRAEEFILLTILKLKDNAYGVSIREQILKDTGSQWSFASIYTPLNKLKRKGFVKKNKGNPIPERGGKSKYFYQVTKEGRKALIELYEARQKIWSGVPRIITESEADK
jgi:DNA-binding PadR family transcriptional regulator